MVNTSRQPLRLLFTVIRIVVPIGLMVVVLSQIRWEETRSYFLKTPWWVFLLAALFYLIAHVLFALRWQFLLARQGNHISVYRLLRLIMIALFASNFLPTTIGGDLVRMVGISREFPNSKGVAAASVVADRLYNVFGMVILLLPSIVELGFIQHLLGSGVGSAGIIPISRWKNKIADVWRDARLWFTEPGTVVFSLFLSVISVLVSLLAFWSILLALSAPVSYLQAVAIAVVVYFITIIPIAINGLGIQEGSITYLLILVGATSSQAGAAAILIRLVTILVSLIGGLWLLFDGQDILKAAKERTEPMNPAVQPNEDSE